MTKILILGCGNKPIKGAINHDVTKHSPWVDVAHDLNVFPWPWTDNEFDVVQAWAVLEHLRADRLQIMNELWRIVKPGGRAVLNLPYWKNEASYSDITHYWFATLDSLDQFDPGTERGRQYAFYTPCKWKVHCKRFSNTGHSSIHFKLEKLP